MSWKLNQLYHLLTIFRGKTTHLPYSRERMSTRTPAQLMGRWQKRILPYRFQRECGSTNTLISDSWPLELWNQMYLCFKPTVLWCFITAALGKKDSDFLNNIYWIFFSYWWIYICVHLVHLDLLLRFFIINFQKKRIQKRIRVPGRVPHGHLA